MSQPKICIIGEVVIDVTLSTPYSETKMRLGGIVHAARGLWAQDIPFAAAYFAPSYLDAQIENYLSSLGCRELKKLGDVVGAPGVVLIEEAKEVGNQGYEFLLRDELKIKTDNKVLKHIAQQHYKDVFVISGNFGLSEIITKLNGNIHVDLANNITEFSDIASIGKRVDTVFLSTSSQLFSKFYQNDFFEYANHFQPYVSRLVLKENRGGSRAFDFTSKEYINIPSQPRKIVHSVGVGDVYDATYVWHNRNGNNLRASLTLASWIAAEYACTTYPDDLKKNVQRVLQSPLNELVQMPGVLLPWEKRKTVQIYLAAPDFSFIDTKYVDAIDKALTYHNFTPRRPVKENGEMEKDAPKERRQDLFHKDMEMLSQCQILIAILLFHDPGTLIEIGLAAAKGLPTIVYDPYRIANNCMLTELPTLLTSNPDELMTEVFYQSSKLMQT